MIKTWDCLQLLKTDEFAMEVSKPALTHLTLTLRILTIADSIFLATKKKGDLLYGDYVLKAGNIDGICLLLAWMRNDHPSYNKVEKANRIDCQSFPVVWLTVSQELHRSCNGQKRNQK